MNVIADLLQRGKQIRVRWTEGGAVDHERRPDNNQRRTAFRALDSLLNRKTADGLHRDRDRGNDLVDLVEGAESADQAALVEADMVDDHVDAKALHPLRGRDAVACADIVSHDVDPEF